jgi:hypothetical protein
MRPKIIRGNVFAGLSENRMASPGIKLAMIGNGECLFLPRLEISPEFDMAAALRKNGKTELLKDRTDFRS